MDFNRDEATRAREMAEKKLMENDISGAKSHASKARELYPGLDGLFQLQQVLEIYTAYDRRIGGEVDWYGVLGVVPFADAQTLRRSYRKLALALHPDKNKAVGAEGAFKIVSEAWSLLSDTVKRASYDRNLNIRASNGTISGLSTAAGIQVNVKCNFNNSASTKNNFCTPDNLPTHSTPAGNNFFTPVKRPTHSTPIRPNGNTFWTLCMPCKTQYEYLVMYRNQTILCRNCHRPFLALEVPPPANSNIPRRKNSKCQNQKSDFPAGNTSADSGKEFTPAPKMPSLGSSHADSVSKENNQKTSTSNKRTSARAAAQCVDGSQLTGEHLMRGHNETINVVDVEKMCNASNDTNGSEPLLQCQNQKSGFPAGNTSADFGKEFTPAPKMPSPGSSHADSVSKENNQKTSTSKVGGSRNKRTSARAAAQCVDGSQLTGEHLIRGHDETINVVDVEKTCNAPNDTNGSEPLLQCQNQKSGFPAGNTSADFGKEFTPAPKMPSPGSSHADSVSKENNQKTSTSKVGGSRNKRTSARAAAQCVDGSQLTGEHLIRGHDETINVVDVEKTCNAPNDTKGSEPCYGLSLGKDEKLSKKAQVGHYKASLLRKASSGSCNDSLLHMDMQGTGNLFYPENSRCNVSKKSSLSGARSVLVVKANMEIRKKLQEWNATAAKNTFSSKKVNEDVDKDMPTVLASTLKARNSNTSSKGECISSQPRNSSHSSGLACSFVRSTDVVSEDVAKGSSASSLMGSDTEGNELKIMSVPDPEFYDFDKDRIEEVFAANQVWAAYDNEDGMPRNYILIHDVIRRKPFKVQISWLNSKSNSEPGQLNWVGCGFANTCGDFRIGKREAYSNVFSISHRVKWSKGPRGVIRIFPQKGDVWALYRNWSSEWNEQTLSDVICQYDMVEVADDFSEGQGVFVTPLVKVAGFRSVFHRLDTSKEYRIPIAEMFRFSHQVTSYTLTGQEAKTVPKGCLELDTAAMPLELLQIITESMEREGSKESRSRDANAGKAITRVYSRKRKEIKREPGEGSKQSRRDDATARSPITRVYSRKHKEIKREPGEGSKQSRRDDSTARSPITHVYSRKRKEIKRGPGEGIKQSKRDDATARSPITLVYSRKHKGGSIKGGEKQAIM